MIIAITPNPALDVTYHLDQISLGEVHRVHEYIEKPGGKGLNVARVLAQLGEQVTVSGFLGGNTGRRINQLLAEVDGASLITPAWIEVRGETRRSIAVVTGDDATVFNEAGESVSWEDWARLHGELVSRAHRNDVVAISGSLPPDSPPDALPAIIRDLHEVGARVIVDTSGAGLVQAAKAGAALLKPNHLELREALGMEDIDAAARSLIEMGAEAVVVSAGADGMRLYASAEAEAVSVKPPHVHGNPTGAGDASVAAWSRVLADSVTWDAIRSGNRALALEAVIEAVATSAAAVAMPVAGEIDIELYQRLKTQLKESTC